MRLRKCKEKRQIMGKNSLSDRIGYYLDWLGMGENSIIP